MLIEHHSPIMQRIAENLIGPALRAQVDAADLVQSVQLTLWMGLRTGKFVVPNSESLLALAKTLLRRQVARCWRTAKLEMTATLEANFVETIIDQNLYASTADADPGRGTDFDDLMEKFLGQLDKVDQCLVKLRFQGYTTAEAANSLQIDSAYLRVRLGRLRKKFADFRHALTTPT